MIDFLLASQNVPFTSALVFMMVIGLIEAFGLGGGLVGGLDVDVDAAVDLDASAGGSFLQWLNVGRLPFLIWLVAFLTTFGLIGLIGQRILVGTSGLLLPSFIAAPIALVLAIPLSRFVGAGLARIMPKDETTAVSVDTLIGRMATIVLGRAAKDSPAQARVRDAHGQTHYVMVAPDREGVTLEQNEAVLLVRRDGGTFYAIRSDNDALSNG